MKTGSQHTSEGAPVARAHDVGARFFNDPAQNLRMIPALLPGRLLSL
jgi:hypothetical protein